MFYSKEEVTLPKANAGTLAILTNACPLYRDDYFERLAACMTETINIYSFGERSPALCGCHVTKLSYKSMFAGSMLLPIVPVRKLLWVDTLIVNGNPRILSFLFIALLRRLLGRRVIIWGQYRTSESGSRSRQIRLFIWRAFTEFLVYTAYEQVEMRSHPWFRRKDILSINNGLKRVDQTAKFGGDIEDFKSKRGLLDKRILLSCARLLPKNRFDLIPKALQTVLTAQPDCVWVLIGDGPLMTQLKLEARRYGVIGNVVFLGELFDDEKLADWFRAAELFVHPSGLGLSLMKALEYGLPIVTNGNPKFQMPESELALRGNTAITFSLNSEDGIADAIIAGLNLGQAERYAIAVEAQQLCNDYNTAAMALQTCKLIDGSISPG